MALLVDAPPLPADADPGETVDDVAGVAVPLAAEAPGEFHGITAFSVAASTGSRS